MTQRSPSLSLIKGFDEIISRPPNEVNYSTLNGKNMETKRQPGNKIQKKLKIWTATDGKICEARGC